MSEPLKWEEVIVDRVNRMGKPDKWDATLHAIEYEYLDTNHVLKDIISALRDIEKRLDALEEKK